MSQYQTRRGRMIAQDGVELNVREDGSLHMRVDEQEIVLSEDKAGVLSELLGAVVGWPLAVATASG